MRKMRNTCKILVGKHEKRGHFVELGIYGRIIFMEIGYNVCSGFFHLRVWLSGGLL
jgi:hypothetical protein